MHNTKQIRNFAIIAHVDHGKSTLADRFLELTHMVEPGKHDAQMLDRNPISRERGITIKLAPVTMTYSYKSEIRNRKFEAGNEEFTLNLVDTPGHVDFSYEVERTLASVEGAILLVDATQGIQAQTLAHSYKALEQNLTIIPVVNKIDVEGALVAETIAELSDFLGVPESSVYKISAKTGQGVKDLLEAVIDKVPSPSKNGGDIYVDDSRALIFDSYYDPHRGVIAFVRVVNGSIQQGMLMKLLVTNVQFTVTEVGTFTPDLIPCSSLCEGAIGYVVTNLKDIREVRVGDTVLNNKSALPALSGYKAVKPMIFASFFPTDADEYITLKKALEKLYLNDSALVFEQIYSKSLGAGFRVGFLGLLHADVTRERLEREFEQSLVLTPPKVQFQFDGIHYKEPYIKITIITPKTYLGAVMTLCENARATFSTMDTVAGNKNQLVVMYTMPLSEMVSGFFDKLKSITSGYASLDWDFLEYRQVDAAELELLINGEPIDEFSEIVVGERAMERARSVTQKLSSIIPKQQFEIRIQGRYKGKILASERLSALRKDVTAKLYGGDRTRKDKLLKKQKKGKKLMKSVGTVEIPKEAFIKLFK